MYVSSDTGDEEKHFKEGAKVILHYFLSNFKVGSGIIIICYYFMIMMAFFFLMCVGCMCSHVFKEDFCFLVDSLPIISCFAHSYLHRLIHTNIYIHLQSIDFYSGMSGLDGETMYVACVWIEDADMDGLPLFHYWKHDFILEYKPVTSGSNSDGGDMLAHLGILDCEGNVQVLKFHHLLHGSEHKKEKEMVSEARKSGLQGMILYGTPGIVFIKGNKDMAIEYLSEARRIGKTGDNVYTIGSDAIDSMIVASGDYATKYTTMFETKGLQAIDMSSMKEFLQYLPSEYDKALDVILGLM